jgi:hypothetical protein
MLSISMLSEITRGALDPEGWQPLIDARPDWFEVIHLYGTKSGWGAAQAIVTHEDSVARHQHFVDRIAPAARNIHAYWLARRARQERPRRPVHKAPAPGRNDHARADPARSSSAATGRRTHCTELLPRSTLLPLSQLRRFDPLATPSILSAVSIF